MKTTFPLAALTAVICITGSLNAQVSAQATNDRPVVRDERPELARGWVIVAKSTYWPLCYEALERLEEVRELADSTDKTALADSLHKCSAWLNLAASAAMVNEEARILTIADQMEGVASDLEDGKPVPTKRELEVLASMGKLAVGRSHVVRAMRDFTDRSVTKTTAPKKDASDFVKQEEKEIAKARLERDREQYQYDTGQAYRHLIVAQTYVREACEQEGIDLGELATAKVEPLTGSENLEDLTSKDGEIRQLAGTMEKFIKEQQARLATEFKWHQETE